MPILFDSARRVKSRSRNGERFGQGLTRYIPPSDAFEPDPPDRAWAAAEFDADQGRAPSHSGQRASHVRLATIGDLLNVLISAIEAAGLEPEDSSVDETGFDITLGGRLVRIGFHDIDRHVDNLYAERMAEIYGGIEFDPVTMPTTDHDIARVGAVG